MQQQIGQELRQLLSQIDELQQEVEEVRPLSKDASLRLEQKIRLDWTYHSNAIEGNQLSLGETRTFILYGLTAKGKPFKDHLDIKGHNEAVKLIQDVVREERPLTETFIRELHQVLLKEPYEMPAQSPDGIPTKRRIEVGSYKQHPNHVKLQTGEMFFFASPEDTPAMMAELMAWYRAELGKGEVHPLLLAGNFHYEFVRIHPFDDGNGRMSRILMNLILMQTGFSPIIIRQEDRNTDYLPALQEADTGNLEPFFLYLGQRLLAAQQLLLKAAKGESLEEPDDVSKRIAILKQGIEEKERDQVKELRTEKRVWELAKNDIQSVVAVLMYRLKELNELFLNNAFEMKAEGKEQSGKPDRKSNGDYIQLLGNMEYIEQITFLSHLKAYKHTKKPFDVSTKLVISFESYTYKISVDKRDSPLLEKLYHESLTDAEINQVVQATMNHILDLIEQQVQQQDS